MIAPKGPKIGNLLAYVGFPLLTLFLYDGVIVALYMVVGWKWVALPHIPLTLFGSAIGIILAFRNGSSYARWWEARTLWGGIVNNSRSWSRQVLTAIHAQGEQTEVDATRKHMIYLQIAWVHALRQQLRGLPPLDETRGLLTEEESLALASEKNVPFAIQRMQGDLLTTALDRKWIDILQWTAMDSTLNDLADSQGGSEKIKNTPMPRQYDYYPQLFVHIYCLLLPLALVQNMEWFTPLGSTLVGFIFLALDKLGRDLEDPFDNSINDIPLLSMSRTIEINLRQALGEKSLPEPIVAVKGVIW